MIADNVQQEIKNAGEYTTITTKGALRLHGLSGVWKAVVTQHWQPTQQDFKKAFLEQTLKTKQTLFYLWQALIINALNAETLTHY